MLMRMNMTRRLGAPTFDVEHQYEDDDQHARCAVAVMRPREGGAARLWLLIDTIRRHDPYATPDHGSVSMNLAEARQLLEDVRCACAALAIEVERDQSLPS